MTTDSEPVGMACPACGQPPVMGFAEQAFCGNERCRVVTWNPTMTMAQLREDWHVVDTSGLDGLD